MSNNSALKNFFLRRQNEQSALSDLLAPVFGLQGRKDSPQTDETAQAQPVAVSNYEPQQVPQYIENSLLPPFLPANYIQPALTAPIATTALPAQDARPQSDRGRTLSPEQRAGIFAGESGGDYDALFNFQNREGGKFSHVRVTDMTVDEAIKFTDPRGPYASYVRSQVGRTATPIGAYQIVGSTLRAAAKGLGLRGDERMTPELQDRLADWIYQNQGLGAWVGYRGPRDPNSIRPAAASSRSGSFTGISEPEDFSNSPLLQDTTAELTPEQERRNRITAAIDAFSRGLGQMSRGETVNIGQVFEAHRERQEAMRQRLQEINEARRTREGREALLQQVARQDPQLAQLGATGEEGFAQMQQIMKDRAQNALVQENIVFQEQVRRESAALEADAQAARDRSIIANVAEAFRQSNLDQYARMIETAGDANMALSLMERFSDVLVTADANSIVEQAAKEELGVTYSGLYGEEVGRIARTLGKEAADEFVANRERIDRNSEIGRKLIEIGEATGNSNYVSLGVVIHGNPTMDLKEALDVAKFAEDAGGTTAIQNFRHLLSLSPEEQDGFLEVLRLNQPPGMSLSINEAGTQFQLQPTGGGSVFGTGRQATANQGDAQGTAMPVVPGAGTTPSGLVAVPDPDAPGGFRYERAAGVPTEEERQRQQIRNQQISSAAGTVLREITRANEWLDRMALQGEGVISTSLRAALSFLPGSSYHRLMQDLESMKANLGLDRLQALRESSPTGGALGQIPFQQQLRLEQVYGAFENTTSPTVLRENLAQLNNIYLDIVFGTEAERATLVERGTLTSEENARIQANYRHVNFDEFGRRRSDDSEADVPPMPSTIPSHYGVDANSWRYMSPEGRDLFIRRYGDNNVD